MSNNQSTLPQSVLDAINEKYPLYERDFDNWGNATRDWNMGMEAFREAAIFGYGLKEDIVPGVQTPQKGRLFIETDKHKMDFDIVGHSEEEEDLVYLKRYNPKQTEEDFVPSDNGSKTSTLATLPSEPEPRMDKEKKSFAEAMKKFNEENPTAFDWAFWSEKNEPWLIEPQTLFAKHGLELHLICGACPEQYDVFVAGTKKQVGYIRLRNGEFRVDFPDCGDTTIYEANPIGDGVFDDQEERMRYLSEALQAILKSLPPIEQSDELSVANGMPKEVEAGTKKPC